MHDFFDLSLAYTFESCLKDLPLFTTYSGLEIEKAKDSACFFAAESVALLASGDSAYYLMSVTIKVVIHSFVAIVAAAEVESYHAQKIHKLHPSAFRCKRPLAIDDRLRRRRMAMLLAAGCPSRFPRDNPP